MGTYINHLSLGKELFLKQYAKDITAEVISLLGLNMNPFSNAVDTVNSGKAQFCNNVGSDVKNAIFTRLTVENPSSYLVCLVDNGGFTAAAIVYNEREFCAFTEETDIRSKKWFVISKNIILQDTFGQVITEVDKEWLRKQK